MLLWAKQVTKNKNAVKEPSHLTLPNFYPARSDLWMQKLDVAYQISFLIFERIILRNIFDPDSGW